MSNIGSLNFEVRDSI